MINFLIIHQMLLFINIVMSVKLQRILNKLLKLYSNKKLLMNYENE